MATGGKDGDGRNTGVTDTTCATEDGRISIIGDDGPGNNGFILVEEGKVGEEGKILRQR